MYGLRPSILVYNFVTTVTPFSPCVPCSNMSFLTQPSQAYKHLITAVVLILVLWLSGLLQLDHIKLCTPGQNCGLAASNLVIDTGDYGHEQSADQNLTSGSVIVNVSTTQDAEISIYPNVSPPLPPGDDEEYVALCLAVKDQVEDLPEYFIYHYYHLGIRRFYIMDDGSNPPISAAKGPGEWGIPDSAIIFHYFDRSARKGSMQHAMYAHCHEWHGHEHKWFGFFDADELLSMTSHYTTSPDGH